MRKENEAFFFPTDQLKSQRVDHFYVFKNLKHFERHHKLFFALEKKE